MRQRPIKSNDGEFSIYGRRKYAKVSIMKDEDCRKQAVAWVRENASFKEKPT